MSICVSLIRSVVECDLTVPWFQTRLWYQTWRHTSGSTAVTWQWWSTGLEKGAPSSYACLGTWKWRRAPLRAFTIRQVHFWKRILKFVSISCKVDNTTRYFFSDGGRTFDDISDKFRINSKDGTVGNGSVAVLEQIHAHPESICRYVFTDPVHKYLFMTKDCGQTVTSHALDKDITPSKIVFDKRWAAQIIVKFSTFSTFC